MRRGSEQRTTAVMDVSELPEHRRDWVRDLRAKDLSARTIAGYERSLVLFEEWFATSPEFVDKEIRTGDIKDYMEYLKTRKTIAKHRADKPLSETYRLNQFVGLQQFFKWAVSEHLCRKDIFVGMTRPRKKQKPIPVIPDAQLSALFAAITNDQPEGLFEEFCRYRDEAIIRVLIDTGMRLSGLLSMSIDRVDFDSDIATVRTKGDKTLEVPFSPRTGSVMRRYLRVRRRYVASRYTRALDEEPAFWIGRKGVLGDTAVVQILRKRCEQAGIPHINPHRFRHTTAHQWLLNGGTETSLSQLMGWETGSQMLKVYGQSAAHARAVAEHRRLSLADRF